MSEHEQGELGLTQEVALTPPPVHAVLPNLQPFNGPKKLTCDKCGSDRTSLRWHKESPAADVFFENNRPCRPEPWVDGTLLIPEHFDVTCRACGYEWLMDMRR